LARVSSWPPGVRKIYGFALSRSGFRYLCFQKIGFRKPVFERRFENRVSKEVVSEKMILKDGLPVSRTRLAGKQ